MSYGSAIWVSFVSALVYHLSYRGIICMKIDDSVGAGAIHFFCGAWGLLAAGFTATEAARADAGLPSEDECSSGSQALANFVAMVGIGIYVRRGLLKRRRLVSAYVSNRPCFNHTHVLVC